MKRTRRMNDDAPGAQPAQPGRPKRQPRAIPRPASDKSSASKRTPRSTKIKKTKSSHFKLPAQRSRKISEASLAAEPQAATSVKVIRPRRAHRTRVQPTMGDADEAALGRPKGHLRLTFNLRHLFAVLLGAMVIVGIVVVAVQNAPRWLAGAASAPTASAQAGIGADATARSNRVGIVSGHRGNDSGTVCQDGLTEAQVNFDHATRVAAFLRAEGYTVDVLDEFDPRLKGYRAAALLSIHADSCAYINDLATGYKVARAMESRDPTAEDALVACLTARYKQATGLRFHANTVTFDMTQYHAFREVDPDTPAAIIETGFLYLDRPVLTRKPEAVAQGIAGGLLCFLHHAVP